MELLNRLYNLMGLVFVLGTIILILTMMQITAPLRNSRFVIVSLIANFIIPPLAALLLIRVFSLEDSLAVGLVLVSLAAGAPGLPKTAVFAKVDTAAATGLMVLLVVVTIIVLPIVGRLFQKLLFSRPALAMMLRQGVGWPSISLSSSTYLGDSQQVHSIATIFSYALTNLDLLYPPIERALAGYEGPSLVGWGDKDPFFSTDQGRRTANLVGGTLSLYTGAGHFTPEECVEEIVADLRQLMQ